MAKAIRMDSATTAEVLAQATDAGRVAALRNALGTGTQTVSIKDNSAVEKLTGTFAGTVYSTTGGNFLPQTALASVSGAGGSVAADWTCRITAANGRWFEGEFGTGEVFSATGALSSSGTTSIKVSLGSATLPGATPPSPVASGGWIVQSTDSPVVVPSDFLGLHSDYTNGATRPPDPAVSAYVGTVRSLDWYPNSIYAPCLSWWVTEPTAGNYNWTYMDQWVATNRGKTFIYLLDRTPSFYQKSDESTSYNERYPSYPGSSAPPSDYTKVANLFIAILERYPDETFIFEMGNEHNYKYNTGTTYVTEANKYDVRWDDTFAAAIGGKSPFSSAKPRTVANGTKVVRQALNVAGYSHVKLLSPSFVDQTSTNVHNSMKRYLSCPTDGGGVAADYIDGVAYHVYSYNLTESSFKGETEFYQGILSDLSITDPLYCTEIGHEDPNGNSGSGSKLAYNLTDAQQAIIMRRWTYQCAALGVKSICLYKASAGLDEEARTLKYYATPSTSAEYASNTSWRNAMAECGYVNGRTITQAAILQDGRTWLAFSDGTTKVA